MICDEYASSDERVKIIHQENAGVAVARNVGIEAALNGSSKYLMFVDSDDWLHSFMLENMMMTLKNTDLKIGVCWSKRVDSYENDKKCDVCQYKVITPEEFFITSPADAAVPWGKVYKKELFLSVRFSENRLNEDLFFTHLVLFKEKQIALVDYPFYYYFKNLDGLSNTRSMKKRKDAIEGQRLRIQFFLDNGFFRAYEYEYNKPSCIALEMQALNEGLIPNKRGIKQELQKRLRKALRDQKMSLTGHEWLYELAYPRLMKMYWVKEAGQNRIRKIFRE